MIRRAAFTMLVGCSGATLNGGSAGDAPVPTSLQACTTPGTAETTPSAAALVSALAGRWLVCEHDPSSPSVLLARDGVEFTADGHWNALKPDNFGGYERTITTGTFGTYALYLSGQSQPVPLTDTTASAWITLRLNELNLDVTVGFETGPRRMLVRGGVEASFVPVEATPN
jgi:hypothetical protein